jgi:hypothetical protein
MQYFHVSKLGGETRQSGANDRCGWVRSPYAGSDDRCTLGSGLPPVATAYDRNGSPVADRSLPMVQASYADCMRQHAATKRTFDM